MNPKEEKQNSIEYFYRNIKHICKIGDYYILHILFEEAKKMYEKELNQAHKDGYISRINQKHKNYMTSKEKFMALVSGEDNQTLVEIKERMKIRELENTAVEWLIDWMKANQYSIGNDLLEAVHTAKAMEYSQNKKMYERGAGDFIKKVNQFKKK